MAAYAIGALTVRNTDWQKEYGEKMALLIKKYGGKVIAKSPPQVLEAVNPLPDAVVVIEFTSAEQVQAWYHDPDHAALKQLRRSGSDIDLLLVNGL